MFKIVKGAALAFTLVACGGLFTTTAQASTHPRPATLQTYRQKPTFLVKQAKNTYVWNARHTKRLKNLKSHLKMTLTATKLVTMRVNGKNARYYYVHNQNRHVKGYVKTTVVVAGRYVAGGYYSYPTKGILLSTVRYQPKEDAVGQADVFGTKSKTAMAPYLKTPSLKRMKATLKFYRQHVKSSQLPTSLQHRVTPGVRVTLQDVWTTTNKADIVKAPFVQTYAGSKKNPYWLKRANFTSAADLAATKLQDVQSMGAAAAYTRNFDGFYYDYPSPTASFVTSALGGPIYHIYGAGYGAKKDLSLVDWNHHLRYVATANIFSIPNTKPVLKDGIWYTTQSMTAGTIKNLDPAKSQTYRLIGGYYATQYHYAAGQWQSQLNIFLDPKNVTDNSGNTVTVSVSRGTGTLLNPSDSGDFQPVQEIGIDDATALTYLYQPTAFYTAYLK